MSYTCEIQTVVFTLRLSPLPAKHSDTQCLSHQRCRARTLTAVAAQCSTAHSSATQFPQSRTVRKLELLQHPFQQSRERERGLVGWLGKVKSAAKVKLPEGRHFGTNCSELVLILQSLPHLFDSSETNQTRLKLKL